LRVARFAARFGFRIAPETLELMRKMAESGEADALVPERVWQEVARGLMEAKPSRMFGVLRDCGALARVMPEIDALWDDPDAAQSAMRALDDAARQQGATLPARFAALTRSLTPLAVESLARRLKIPADCRDLALLAARHSNIVLDAAELGAEAVLEVFDLADAWRRPERFAELMTAAFADETDGDPTRARLERALKAAAAVRGGDIARVSKGADAIRINMDAARLDAIRKALQRDS
jgi:tRNA nucleotidyltransferase (CCA-adding enzyme)